MVNNKIMSSMFSKKKKINSCHKEHLFWLKQIFFIPKYCGGRESFDETWKYRIFPLTPVIVGLGQWELLRASA